MLVCVRLVLFTLVTWLFLRQTLGFLVSFHNTLVPVDHMIRGSH